MDDHKHKQTQAGSHPQGSAQRQESSHPQGSAQRQESSHPQGGGSRREEDPRRPWYYRDIKPSMLRRLHGHDYGAPGFYLVTIMLNDGIPRLCHISGRAFKPQEIATQYTCPRDTARRGDTPRLIPESDHKYGPQVNLHQWGVVASREMYALQDRYHVKVRNLVVMPDHIHALLQITEYEPHKLGGVISSFKGRCSRVYWDASGLNDETPFWRKGYNDKTLYGEGQYRCFNQYIDENPRKYLIRKQLPEYFYHRWQFDFDGETYHATGNIFLLVRPVRSAIRYSRKYSAQQYAALKDYWHNVAYDDDVVISTFIHPDERAITKECTAIGAKLIWIKSDGFPPRSAVKGNEAYALCAEGRLLMIAPATYHTRHQDLTRAQCMRLNDLAEHLATADLLPFLLPLDL